jgi:hypothetical protein
MKTNHKIAIKLTSIALLLSMIIGFTHCVPQTSTEVGNGGSKGEDKVKNKPENPANKEARILSELQVTTGVRNFEQILYTMSALTGLDPLVVRNVYREVVTSLPTDNDIKVFTATQQIAITKLAAEFCYQLSRSNYDTQRNAIFPGLNLNAVPNQALNPANREIFIDQIIQGFWGGMVSHEEADLAHDELGRLIDEAINGNNNATATQRAFRAACTASLSSAYVTFL